MNVPRHVVQLSSLHGTDEMFDLLYALPAPAIVAAVAVIAAIFSFVFDQARLLPVIIGAGLVAILVQVLI